MGYGGYLILENKRFGSVVAGFIALICAFAYINSLGPNNLLYNSTIARLEYDSTSGTIAGNNRFTENVDKAYENIIGTPQALIGLGNDGYERLIANDNGGSSGYKTFILRYGLICALLCFLAYAFPLLSSNNNYLRLFSLCCLLLLAQNAYPDWDCMLINFILGSNHILTNSKS